MLVCSHCQFENPDTNKFCQQCGGVLAEDCPSNERPVEVAAPIEKSELSHEFSHPVYLAIVSRCTESPAGGPPLGMATPTPIGADSLTQAGETEGGTEGLIGIIEKGNLGQTSVQSEVTTSASPIAVHAEGRFLDQNGRYQLLDALPDLQSDIQELEIYVLDHQPLQAASFQSIAPPTDEQSAEAIEPSINLASVPNHARPYLEIQQNYPSLRLPELHDAWEQDGYRVTVLENSSNLPSLTDVCQDETILPLQILYWLHEMVEYWVVLQPYQQCQSLLKLNNLRIDPEDCVLRLQRFYADVLDTPPVLSELGRIWQQLFEQTQRSQPGDLFLLCRDLETGELTSVDALRSRIEEIAERLQHLAEPSVLETLPETSSPIASSSVTPVMDNVSNSVVPSIALESTAGDYMQPTDLGEVMAHDGDDQPTVVLPMQLISIDDAGRTITGRQRDHNEDSFYIQTEVKRIETKKLDDSQERVVQAKGLYILCDGMGGHAGGEVASALAVETLRNYFEEHWQDKLPSEQSIREAIYLANQAIYDQNQDNSRMGSGRMGTTLVLLLLHNADVAIAHVGDSRLYRLSRRRGLEQLTVDHEVGQREIQRGVEPTIAYARPDAYQLTQALGPRGEGFINPDVKFLEINEDALLLLCSDGVTDNDLLETEQHRSYLDSMLDIQTNLEQGINNLIDLANQFNGHDNITAIGIRVRVRPNLNQANPR